MSQLSSDDVLVLKDFGSFHSYDSSLFLDRTSNNFISNAGDVNGDGINDLIIGQPGVSTAADSYVIFGDREYGKNSSQFNSSVDDLSLGASSIIYPAFAFITGIILFLLILFKWQLT